MKILFFLRTHSLRVTWIIIWTSNTRYRMTIKCSIYLCEVLILGDTYIHCKKDSRKVTNINSLSELRKLALWMSLSVQKFSIQSNSSYHLLNSYQPGNSYRLSCLILLTIQWGRNYVLQMRQLTSSDS